MNNVKKVRKSKGMSQQRLADLIGASKSYISDLENHNIREPSLGKARLIAIALGVALNDIFPERGVK